MKHPVYLLVYVTKRTRRRKLEEEKDSIRRCVKREMGWTRGGGGWRIWLDDDARETCRVFYKTRLIKPTSFSERTLSIMTTDAVTTRWRNLIRV